ncbi:uncharacterized protein LOC132299819 [Cornus florida]|uniref:uncharacterized protein LOC132299819 n=1 Tax=Cornus florida TaxID=4283 RepID=UPI00289929C2|nr:uncharacterized protein LOC132299819 [Cornus florida]
MSRYGSYTTYQGMDNRSDDWNRPSYVGDDYSDHLCRPVIVDAEGRKRPIISYTPTATQSYVTKVERIVEHVRTPIVTTEYQYSTPTRVEPLNEYGVVNNKWGRPSSPVHDRPQKVEEFITKVQTEVSRPARTGIVGTWRNPAGTNGYGDQYNSYNNNNNSDWNKPSGNYKHDESLADPFIVNKEGWGRESTPKGWTSTPGRDTPLSKPTNDIGTAVEYLKEASHSPSITSPPPQSRFGVPISTTPRKETYTETIDSREAARRYGNFNFSSRPRPAENYIGTIDSREAATKYKGARV